MRAESLGSEVAASGDLRHRSSRKQHSSSIGELDTLDLEALRMRWTAAYGAEPLKRLSRELMARAIAYRLQEKARGGVSAKVLRRLEQIAGGGAISRGSGPSVSSPRTGTRLLREWQGRAHEVVVLDGGFLWKGQIYRSLSEIARLITGTKWSGPRFFGLKEKGREAR